MNNYEEYSDLELLECISRFESLALEELYDRYSSLLYTLIRKISPANSTADKILIDVFGIIWRKADKFNYKNGSVYTWLITLARNKAIDVVRRSRSAKFNLDTYDDKYEDYFIIPTLSKEIDEIDLDTALRLSPKVERALSRLTDTERHLIYLAYYQGYSMNEIADKLKISLQTIRAKVMSSIHLFREKLVKG